MPLWEDRIVMVSTQVSFPKAAARDPSAVVVNVSRREIFRGPAFVRLSPNLFAYAMLLLARRSVTIEDVYEAIWGNDPEGGPDDVPRAVTVMRYKLQKLLPLVGIGIELPRYGLSQAVSLARAA